MFRRARDSRWLIDADDEASIQIKQQVDHIDSRSQLTKRLFDLNLQPLSEAEPLSINPEAADQDACLLVLSNKDILLSSFSWYPIHSRLSQPLKKQGVSLYGHPDITGCYYVLWGGFTRLSSDQGQSWSKHQYLPPLPGARDAIPDKRPYYGGAIRGQAIEVNGEILLPTYGRLEKDKISSSHLYVSKDKGRSWSYRAIIAQDQQQVLDLNEPSLLSLGGDRIMAFIRNTRGNDHLVTAISDDCGHHWAQWQERDVIGHPTHPLKLSDGRIFICYGFRHEPYGIRGHLMDGQGEKLLGDEIIIRDDGFCADVGYPWAIEMPDGKVLVAYYFTQDDGIRHIAASLIELP
ncbi:sialidase family protein [sulfur-oxidizing endosymbiont of Gigantopelta aegis]|uniref:sialidase family protein n=1 Tax=sulfur-oxidizing endosymbiont of Gigantopelta aegis TaxID=2794934 RepID=UPI0018DE7FDA|nr:sialidase family protein [sulfur-oxidizing endosymbiont of Gigantopelta aegis]